MNRGNGLRESLNCPEVFSMQIRIPRKRVREVFLLIYELHGCQKSMDFITKYYGIKRMKVILNGRRVGNGDAACYFKNRAYFSKKGLNRKNALHELYHHLVDANGLELPLRKEEKSANDNARKFLKR
jgi:hypothetical protein